MGFAAYMRRVGVLLPLVGLFSSKLISVLKGKGVDRKLSRLATELVICADRFGAC